MSLPGFATIASLFNGSAPAAKEAPAPAASGQPSGQPADLSQFGQPNQPNPAGSPGAPQNEGLDAFKELFTPLTPEQMAAQQNFDPNALFATLEPAKVQELAGKINYAEGITAEQLQAIQTGGPEAVQALVQALNAVGQRTMTQSLLASAEVTKQALNQANQSLDGRLSSVSRKQAVTDLITSENPMLNHPAAKPIVDALQQAIMAKNPQATPQQIQASVNEYLTAFTGASAKPAPQPTGDQGTDFSIFLS